MHLGTSNENARYFMDNRQLEAVIDERDLSIVMQNNLKVSKQCAKVVGTANRVLGTRVLFVLTWSAAYRQCSHLKGIDLMEKVQTRATRMIAELRHLTYEERLKYRSNVNGKKKVKR